MLLANSMGEEKFWCCDSKNEITADWINANWRWRVWVELSIITWIKPWISNCYSGALFPLLQIVLTYIYLESSLLHWLRIVRDYLVTQTQTIYVFSMLLCVWYYRSRRSYTFPPIRSVRTFYNFADCKLLSYRIRFAHGWPHFACTLRI